jgi:hypothetical protein
MGADSAPVFRLNIGPGKVLFFFLRGLSHTGQGQKTDQRAASQRYGATAQKCPPVDAFLRCRFRGNPLQPLFMEWFHLCQPSDHIA